MDRGQSVKRERNPRETANILSILSFFYTVPLFIKGFKRSLEFDDLYDVLKRCQAKKLGDGLESQWVIENKKHKKPSICKAIFLCFWKYFIVLGIMKLIMKMITVLWSHKAFSKLIAYFNPGQTELSRTDAYIYATQVIGINILNILFNHNYNLMMNELGLRVRTAVCSLLYRKALKLNCDSLSQVTMGKLMTLMTKDVDVFEAVAGVAIDMCLAVVQAALTCYVIYGKIGNAVYAGVAFFFIMAIIQVLIASMSYTLRLKNNKKTDARLEQIQEVLSVIKIIKMYTWERFFEKKISTARKEELRQLHKLYYTKVSFYILGTLTANVAFFIFLMTYLLTGEKANAEIVYLILSCTHDLEFSLGNLIPYALGVTAEMFATNKRAEEVLLAKELSKPQIELKHNNRPNITFLNVTTKICNQEILKNITLTIERGLNIVMGHIGTGKTTLLKTILQDCEFSGNLQIAGTISYASQEPWLFPASIKNNIIFAEKFHELRYKNILKICSLDYDLELLQDGDETIIGDRGINLSKGQQARINLARAIYKESDIYLLDDCLAALDGHVSDSIFHECIEKFLKNKLCIFVTNNYDYVKAADQVIVIDSGSANFTKKITRLLLVENNKSCSPEDVKIEEDNKEEVRKRVFQEQKKAGGVSWNVYYQYVRFGGGPVFLALLLGWFILAQGVTSYSEKTMSQWVTLEQNLSSYNSTDINNYEKLYQERNSKLNLYIAVMVSSLILILLRAVAFFNFARFASINMHRTIVRSVLSSTMKFFDSHFIGNILNRFSKDCMALDEYLPFIIMECLMMVFATVGGIVLISSVHAIYIVELLIVFFVACCIKVAFQPTGNALQRLFLVTRSPMVGHLNSTLEGLTTIRASKAQEIITTEFDRHQNLYTSANYMLNTSLAALAFSLESVCAIFIDLVIIQFFVTNLESSVGDVGLAITQSFVMTNFISFGIKSLYDCETLMTSIERMLEYTKIEQEVQSEENQTEWPKQASIIFNHVSLDYSENSRGILKDISLVIKSGEKLGIVGRTGSGKSSIISSLLRLYPTSGTITIDGVNITDIPLRQLRCSITVIPQDPILFSGTIRENLDPYQQYNDEEIWKTLDELKLKVLIHDLDIKVDKGATFSAGQKQLLCLCRAILRKNKIVVLDEATANVDRETDALIQKTIQKYFHHCTVIIIAHRLSSVLNCDKVVVLNQGYLTEFDEPKKLLQNKNSFLHSVVK